MLNQRQELKGLLGAPVIHEKQVRETKMHFPVKGGLRAPESHDGSNKGKRGRKYIINPLKNPRDCS